MRDGGAEHKFLLTPSDAAAFLREVDGWIVPEVYAVERPIAWVRTTYLDSDDLVYLRSSRGPVRRRLRVREYAAAMDTADRPVLSGVCFLELKESCGGSRLKIRAQATAGVIGRLVESGGRDVPAGSPAPLVLLARRIRAERAAPQLTTFYRRMSFADRDGLVRITVDDAIQFCRPTAIGALPVEPPEVLGVVRARVLEVKYAGFPPAWLARAMALLEETHGWTKFGVGARALDLGEKLAG